MCHFRRIQINVISRMQIFFFFIRNKAILFICNYEQNVKYVHFHTYIAPKYRSPMVYQLNLVV